MYCACVAPAMLDELCKRIQNCRATLRLSRNKRNVGNELLVQKFDQFQTLQNNSQQHATTCNRVVKRTQHVTYKNVGSCWPNLVPRALFPGFGKSALGTRLLLANNVVPVCTRLNNFKTKLGGEICASDLNTHKGYCGTRTLDQFQPELPMCRR